MGLKFEPIAVNQTQAAVMLGVTPRTIYRWDRQGMISGKTVGGVRLYLYADLVALATAGKSPENLTDPLTEIT